MLEHVVAQRPDRYLRSPRLVVGAQGPELHAIAWGGLGVASEEHVAFGITLDPLAVGPVRRVAAAPALLDLAHADVARITEDAGDEDRAWHLDHQVSIEREQGRSRVVLVRAGLRTVVWDAFATASAPALAVGDGGTWVAFHHNLREDTAEPDLTKWIELRFVDLEGRVHEPAAPMRDRDRDRQGEEQGFEFPTLVVGPDGAVALFGRGSHRFWRQDLNAEGFGERAPLGSGDWGCRGRRAHAVAVGEGVLIARRERTGIALQLSPAPTGGKPRLRPVNGEARASPARARLRPRARDPAERWNRRTLFGDIHQHSAHSDGCGTAHEPYLRARHLYGDDFCALSDHESFLGKRIGPGEWRYLEEVAAMHDEPGTFATLFAYEWTGKSFPGPGHKVVYSDRAGTAIVSRDLEATGQGLLARLRESGSIAVPHHVGWTGADEAAHDPEVQPVWEICSCHGCYLTAQHPLGARGDLRDQMVEEVLKRGARFGFIACSDGHGLLFHHGVGRKRDPFRTGLTAVQAESHDRGAILRAIRERRSYATSGVPIYLDVDAEGQPMGSVLRGPRQVRMHAATLSPIRSLSLVGPRGVLATTAGEGLSATLEGHIASGWAYARVEQVDGEMAWSSPVWVG